MAGKMDMTGVAINILTPVEGGLINPEAMGLSSPTANSTSVAPAPAQSITTGLGM